MKDHTWIVSEVVNGECSALQAMNLGLPYRNELGETIHECFSREEAEMRKLAMFIIHFRKSGFPFACILGSVDTVEKADRIVRKLRTLNGQFGFAWVERYFDHCLLEDL